MAPCDTNICMQQLILEINSKFYSEYKLILKYAKPIVDKKIKGEKAKEWVDFRVCLLEHNQFN